jgi:hypothetical protein
MGIALHQIKKTRRKNQRYGQPHHFLQITSYTTAAFHISIKPSFLLFFPARQKGVPRQRGTSYFNPEEQMMPLSPN